MVINCGWDVTPSLYDDVTSCFPATTSMNHSQLVLPGGAFWFREPLQGFF